MGVFDPDNFDGRPYVGGLNQMGHVVFAAALVGVFALPFDWLWALVCATSLFLSWETYQALCKGAGILDFKADLSYWSAGAVAWSALTWAGYVSGIAHLFPTFALCAWVVEYVRIKRRMKT